MGPGTLKKHKFMVRKYSGLVVKKKYLTFVYAGLSVPTARTPHRTGGSAGKRGLFWNRVPATGFHSGLCGGQLRSDTKGNHQLPAPVGCGL